MVIFCFISLCLRLYSYLLCVCGTVSYAYENRVASVRIISPPLAAPAATRLEVVSFSLSLGCFLLCN